MKKIFALAAIAIGAASSAQAQMQLYGLVDGSIGKSIADDAANKRINFHSGGDDSSGEGNSTTRVGIKGSTDLGSDVKANFKFETGGIGSDGKVNNNGTFFNRQAWFGFSGGFGEVRFGRQDSVPFQTFIDYDYNAASNGVSAAAFSGAGLWLQDRQSRSLQYISPVAGGVKVQLGLQLKDDTVGAKDVVSGAVTWAGGPVSVSASFQTKGTTSGKDYFGIGGSYDFGAAKVMLGYHDQKTDKGINVGAQATFGGVNVGAIYAVKTKSANNKKGSAYELFVNKEVLKNTYAYAEVGIADKKTSNKGTGFALGVIYTF